MNNLWHLRFNKLAREVSKWSKDKDHQVGAVIVDSFNRVLGLGYNGPPRRVVDNGLERRKEVLRTLHAELNAILNSNCSLNGATIYVYPFCPCAQCAAAIIQVGITDVIYDSESNLVSWRESQVEALDMFKEAGVHVQSLDHSIKLTH